MHQLTVPIDQSPTNTSQGIIQGAAGTVQSYGISVGIDKLGYKIWVVYIVYNSIQLALAYFLFPEVRL